MFPQAREYAQFLSNLAMEQSLKFLVVDVTNIQSFMNKLNKISISKINKHHQTTINSHSRNVWYDEDIAMGLCFCLPPCCVMLLAYFFNWNIISYLCILIVYYKIIILHWHKQLSWRTLIIQQLRPKHAIIHNMTFG